jgi:uncharacterized LabA/DUF88 family protein
MSKTNNYAFIDWQNLNLWTKTEWWIVDIFKFRVYLKDKYNVLEAYYFLWHIKDENKGLYLKLQKAWFIVVFKEQIIEMKSNKKWNIDSDMIFCVMEKLLEEPDNFDKIVMVSGDWDFKILVDFLIKKWRLEKILFPNKKFMSSLYKTIKLEYKDFLVNVKPKIEHKKREAS